MSAYEREAFIALGGTCHPPGSGAGYGLGKGGQKAQRLKRLLGMGAGGRGRGAGPGELREEEPCEPQCSRAVIKVESTRQTGSVCVQPASAEQAEL